MEPTEQKGSSMTLVWVIIAIIIIAGALFFIMRGGDEVVESDTDTTPPAVVTEPTPPPAETATTTTTGQTKSFTVTGKSYSFTPGEMKVKRGDKVKITFQNTGGTHDFVIDEFNARTKVLQSGQSEVVEFIADKTGSFEYYCSVGTHRAMGMKGTLIVE